MSTEEFIEGIQAFGLTYDEAKTYLALVERGPNGNTVNRLKDDLDISRTTIYGILERLITKKWVIDKDPKSSNYIAQPPFKILNKIMDDKTKELELLSEISHYIDDNLERIYQGKKELTADMVHPYAKKYIEILLENKWEVISEIMEESKALNRRLFEYELRSPTGFQREARLIIFAFDRNVEDDEHEIQALLNIGKSKASYEIQKLDIPGLVDIKNVKDMFNGYHGASIYLKFKTGSMIAKYAGTDWYLAAKEVCIPKNYQLIFAWCETDNFDFLMNTIIENI